MIIIGLGISGAVLALEAYKRGIPLQLYDVGRGATASRAAAGMLNPITGKKFVRTWLADTVFPKAWKFYEEAEDILGASFFRKMPIERYFNTVEEQQEFQKRLPSYPPFQIEHIAPSSEFPLGGMRCLSGARVDTNAFLDAAEFFFQEKKMLRQSPPPDEVLVDEGLMVVWCEGAKAARNPLWKDIVFVHSKGETLHLRDVSLPADCIKKEEVALVPLTSGEFFVGARYDKFFRHELPSEEGYSRLIADIAQLAELDESAVIDHRSGTRTAGYDMKPVIGRHRLAHNHFIFNGMSSKALSVAPYFAEKLLDYMGGGEPLPDEVHPYRKELRQLRKAGIYTID